MADLTEPIGCWLRTFYAEVYHLPISKQSVQVSFEERLVVETVVPTPAATGTGEGDMIPIFLGEL